MAVGQSPPGLALTLAAAASRMEPAPLLLLRNEIHAESCPGVSACGKSETGKGPPETISSQPLLQQGQPEQAAQGCTRSGFDDLEGWSLQNPAGQPVPGLALPPNKHVLYHS